MLNVAHLKEVPMGLSAEEKKELLAKLKALDEELSTPEVRARVDAEIDAELKADHDAHMRELARSREVVRAVW
jgi:hypothetical protein